MKNNKWMVRQRGFDSLFEERLKLGVLKDAFYHVDKISYSISKTYNPDWTVRKDGKIIYIEAKGRFMDRQECAKYTWVKKALDPAKEELVFLFMKPDLAMPNARPRKDGSKQTHADWADTNNFRWFTESTIGKIL